jgi:hypothetical protein
MISSIVWSSTNFIFMLIFTKVSNENFNCKNWKLKWSILQQKLGDECSKCCKTKIEYKLCKQTVFKTKSDVVVPVFRTKAMLSTQLSWSVVVVKGVIPLIFNVRASPLGFLVFLICHCHNYVENAKSNLRMLFCFCIRWLDKRAYKVIILLQSILKYKNRGGIEFPNFNYCWFWRCLASYMTSYARKAEQV